MYSFQAWTVILSCVVWVCLVTPVSSGSKRANRQPGLKEVRFPYHELMMDARAEEEDGEEREEERWLVDEIDYPNYDYQGDAPAERQGLSDALCPPYPTTKAPLRACRARVCKTDKDCHRANQRCCFNGCKFTCTAEMTQPAVVDWQKEPRRRGQSGTSWLIKGPEQPDDVEPCTTTKDPDDGDPLLCPHGYVCHIIDPGDPKTGVPNRGQCMKEKEKEEENRSRQRILKTYLGASGRCLLGTTIIRDQTIILKGDEKEKCICNKGRIRCGENFIPANRRH